MDITTLEGGCCSEGGGGGANGTINQVNMIYEVVFEFKSTDPIYPDAGPLETTLDASFIGEIPWKEEAVKESWPCMNNDFYPHGKEALVLQFAGEAGMHVLAAPQRERGYFTTASFDEWSEVNEPGPTAGSHVRPMDQGEWQEYMYHWRDDPDCEREGEFPYYPENEFLPSKLYVYEPTGEEEPWTDPCTGEPFFYPEDAGLVMVWGDEYIPPGSFSSAWKWVYGADPDLRRSIIKVTVTPPAGCGINTVSFAIEDGAKRRCSWQWNVPGTIKTNKPTTVTIDPSIQGVAATKPRADAWACNNNFNLANSKAFDVDENGLASLERAQLFEVFEALEVGAIHLGHLE